MKISVIGYSGAGKSTLACYLGEMLDIPVLHLDAVHWLPGWNVRPSAEKTALIERFLNENSSWVIDGNYFSLFSERRMKESDIIIFLDFNRFSCLRRVTARYKKYKGRTREDMGKGCEEKIDIEFIKWVLFSGRTSKIKKRYNSLREYCRGKFITLKNQKQLDKFKEREIENLLLDDK